MGDGTYEVSRLPVSVEGGGVDFIQGIDMKNDSLHHCTVFRPSNVVSQLQPKVVLIQQLSPSL